MAELNDVDKVQLVVGWATGGMQGRSLGGQPQMPEYFSNYSRIFDTGDDSTLAAALRTGEHVDSEDAAHQFSPE